MYLNNIALENQNESKLKKYRCLCGKMLFKGILFLSIVEIKCKKCGNICRFCDSPANALGPCSFAFLISPEGSVLEATYSAENILGYSSSRIVGKPIFDFCPELKNKIEAEKKFRTLVRGPHPFEIVQNKFIHQDGRIVPTESYFISHYDKEKFLGYSVFNWLGAEPQAI